jgi:hypothetical protein
MANIAYIAVLVLRVFERLNGEPDCRQFRGRHKPFTTKDIGKTTEKKNFLKKMP